MIPFLCSGGGGSHENESVLEILLVFIVKLPGGAVGAVDNNKKFKITI